ncbi:MAG: hypothetical protein Kow0089_12100 [Desulfobulbaceae bacterium]
MHRQYGGTVEVQPGLGNQPPPLVQQPHMTGVEMTAGGGLHNDLDNSLTPEARVPSFDEPQYVDRFPGPNRFAVAEVDDEGVFCMDW